jgi:hypothetical protein
VAIVNGQLELNDEDWERRLQQALADMPLERAPAGLRRRLRDIPRRDRRPFRLQPRWSLALALVPFLLAGLLFQQQRQQRELEQELAQARQDLAQALHYLERANERAGASVMEAMELGVGQPVSRTTYSVLHEHLDLTQEL